MNLLLSRLRGAVILGFLPLMAAFSVPFATAADTPAAVTVLHCPRLFDSLEGKMLGQTSIVISGDKFEKVEPGYQSVDGAKVIELTDATCLPGLIDDHVHLDGEFSKTTYIDATR
jgi:imidazolonepropionase-like amidohydrolase